MTRHHHRIQNRTNPQTCIAILMLGFLVASFVSFGAEDVAPVARKEPTSGDDVPISESPLSDLDRSHWAFRPVARPKVTQVKNVHWPRHSIDVFILAQHEQLKIAHATETGRAAALRRVNFDLIGLPPTVDELAEFEADDAPDAYERHVDALLASPAYGERWAQHWLDLARFAETDGFEHDKLRTDAWTYRDWVIEALNSNLSYDQFVKLQLAGDELKDQAQPVATMFCLSGPDMPDVNDQFERRHLMLNEMTSTVGSVFLGLQLGCAECHDHKYDPVSQADFYRLRAVFESAVPDLKRDAPYTQLKQQQDAIPARFWVRGDHRRPGPRIEPAFPRIASQTAAGDLPPTDQSLRAALGQWLVHPDNPLTSRVIVNRVWKLHFGRGLFDTPSDVGLMNAEPSHPELLDWLASEFQSRQWDLKWMHRQIICSATYRQVSRAGTDPEWVTRLRSDPDNALFSRGHRRRLDGESVRDAMLAVAGLLTDERGGPGVMPPLPEELVGSLLKGQWNTSPRVADHDRRSIYLFARRNLRYPLFEVFDRPDANASCAVRNRTTTPTQSLLLLNSTLSLRVAQHLAGRVMRESTDSSQQIERLYLITFARHPTADESQRLLRFLAHERLQLEQEKRSHDQLALPKEMAAIDDPYAAAALVEACLAVLNSSEMVYVD